MSDDREDRLDAIIAEYLQRCDAGEPVAADQLVESHPEFREELRDFLLDHYQMQGLAAPLAVPIMSGQPVSSKLRYFGDYELLEEIARGGMGIVYKARQTSLNRIVAVKMILAGRLASKEDERRFQMEAEAAASLRHPNIVTVHEVGKHDHQHYFSMQFIEGKNLSQLTRDRLLPIETSVGYVRQIADAIQYAHEKGTLHRDLKPSNVLIDESDRVQITDFGLAMKVEGESDLTKSGQTLGTPGYMSPEQAQGRRDAIGPASDVYSCGAVLYELLTGRPPFRGVSPVDTLRRLIETEPVSPRVVNPAIPRDLETICLKCLEKDPARRYASAESLARDLERFRDGEPIVARPIGTIARGWRWCKRKPAVAALSFSLFAAVVTTVIGLSLAHFRTSEALDDRNEAIADLQEQKQISDDALQAEKIAVKAKSEALDVRDKAMKQLQWQSYVRGILVAHSEYQKGNLEEADKILDSCGPDSLRSFEWDYLKQLCRRFNGPFWNGRVPTAGLTKSGYAVTFTDGEYHILDTTNGKIAARIPSTSFSRTAALSPDACRFAVQRRSVKSRSTQIEVYRMPQGERHRTITIPSRIMLRGMNFSMDNGLGVFQTEIRTSGNGPLKKDWVSQFTVWDVESGRRMRTTVLIEDPTLTGGAIPTVLGISSNLRFVVTRQSVFDTVKNDRLVKFPGNVVCAAFSGNSRILAWADSQGTITVAELPTGKTLARWVADSTHVSSMAFASDGQQLALGQRNGQIAVRDSTTGRRLYTFRTASALDQIVFLSERRQILTAHHSNHGVGSVRVWNARAPDVLVIDVSPGKRSLWGNTPAFSPDGSLVAGMENLQTAAIWDPGTGRVVNRFPGRAKAHFVLFSPDGKTLAAVGDEGIRLWNHSTGKLLHTLKPKNARYSVKGCFSHDGKFLAGTHQFGVTVWDADTGRELHRFPHPRRYYKDIGFSPDDRFLFVMADNGEGEIWNVPAWKRRCRLRAPKQVPKHAKLNPRGTVLATSNQTLGINFFDTSTGRLLRAMPINGGCGSIDFSPDGKRLLTTTGNDIHLRDRLTGDLILTLTGHRSTVSQAMFSPDGRRIVSTCDDGTIRIWGVPMPSTPALGM